MTSQAVMKRYLTSVAKNNEEYKDNKTIQDIASLISNYKKLDAEDKEVLDAKIEIAYNKLQAKGVSASKSSSKATTTRKAKSSTDGGLKGILADLKKKLGAEKFKDATRGTDIKKDIQIPALKKGKRIVRKKGKTSNQYGTFKNKIGTAYWESRANRYDANQPSQTRKYKLADGGNVDNKIRFDVDFYDDSQTRSDTSVELILRASSLDNVIKDAIKKAYELKKNYIEFYHKNLFLGSVNFAISSDFREGRGYKSFANKYAKGGELEEKGNLNRWSNSGLDEIIKRHEVITEQVRFAFAKVLGLDRAYALLLNDNVGVSPYSLVERAVSSDLLLIDEIDKNLINSAIEQSEDSRRYSESGEGIGSSDITYMLKYMLDGAGLKTDFVKNTLQRVDNNGNVIQLKNELPKTTMFAKGGLTEHGLEVGDEIVMDVKKTTMGKMPTTIGVKDYDKEFHLVDLDKGERYAKGGEVEKPLSYYKYETPKVKIAWRGKIQPFGMFKSAEEAMMVIEKKSNGIKSEIEEYSIVTPDKTIHLGKEYKIRMAKGGKLSSKAKYIPKRDIAEIEVEKNGKSKSIDGANLLDGVYVKKGKYAEGGDVGETMREKIAKMQIFQKIDGQVYVGGIKPKNKVFIDENGYYLVDGYHNLGGGKKYPKKKYFTTSESEILEAYLQDKYAKGGKLKEVKYPIAYIDVLQSKPSLFTKVRKTLEKYGIEIDNSKNFHTKGYAEELYGENYNGEEIYTIVCDIRDASNPIELEKEIDNLSKKYTGVSVIFHENDEYAKGGEVFGAEKFWNELSSKEKMEWLKKRRDIPSDYKSSLSRDSFEKLPDWIKSKVKKAFADNKIYKYGQGGTTKRIKRKGC